MVVLYCKTNIIQVNHYLKISIPLNKKLVNLENKVLNAYFN